MHRVLRGEMVKANITIAKLARLIGVTEKTLRNKINGDTNFTLPEAITIRKLIKSKMSLEDLFARDGTEETG